MNLSRFERKWFYENGDINSLLHGVYKSKLNFKESFPLRKVNSIYLDDNKLSSIYQNLDGVTEKRKLRIRWYGNKDIITNPVVEIKSKKGFVVNKKTDYETSINFNVFSVVNLNENKSIAILKEDKKLIQFLKKYSIEYELFNDLTTTESTVIISDINTRILSSKDGNVIEQNNINSSNAFKDQIDLVNDFVFKGGNAIFLQVPGKTRKRIGPNLTFVSDGTDYLPHKPIKNISQGLWDGILHINSKHKFFNSLPINVNMSGLYENVAPTISLRNFKGQNIVQTIAFDRIPNGNIMKRNYIGSGEVWSGSDLSIVNHGDGKMVLSTLKLLENLNFDPVSEIMLLNMINFFD